MQIRNGKGNDTRVDITAVADNSTRRKVQKLKVANPSAAIEVIKKDGQDKLKKVEDFIKEKKRTIGHNLKSRKPSNELEHELNMEKYVFDNVIQSEELAEEMKHELEEKFYIDDENGRLYQIREVEFHEEFKRVVGYRVDCSGQKASKFDDYPFDVFGEMGLLHLVDLYEIDNKEQEIKWPGNNLSIISKYQLEDPEIKQMMIEGNYKLDDTFEDSRDCFEFRNENYYILRDGPTILVKEGVITNGGKGASRTERRVWQLVIPKVLQSSCIKIMHNGFGHPGSARCLATMRLRYTWNSMRKDVIKHIAECRQCQLRKAYTYHPKVPIQEYPSCCLPLDRVHMDLTGELPITENGNRYLLVVKDAKTKFVWTYPIKDKRAVTVVRVFVNEVINTFGTPKLVITDKGTEFKNKTMDEVARLLSYEKINTTPNNPRANGSVEKHNNTMKDMLSHFVNVRHDDWDEHISLVTSLYNSTVSSATGYTPFYLMFGRENARVNDVRFKQELEGDVELEAYTEKLVECLGLAWEVTTLREHINATRENSKQVKKNKLLDFFIQLTEDDMDRYGKNVELLRLTLRDRVFREYKVGDKFFRKRHPVRAFKSAGDKEAYKISLKLQSRYDGPYEIKEKLSAVLYLADIDGELIKIHAVNMKPELALKEEHLEDYLSTRVKRQSKIMKESEGSESIMTLIGGTTGKKKSPSPEKFESENSNVDLEQINEIDLDELTSMSLNDNLKDKSKKVTWQQESKSDDLMIETKDESISEM